MEELRKRYEDAGIQVEALGRAKDARKEEALQVKAELETAALAGDSEKCAQLMEDLGVIESRWAQILGEEGAAKLAVKETDAAIRRYYEAAAEGGEPVDWTPTLISGERVIYSGWGRSWSAGEFLACDKVLSQADVSAMRYLIVMCKGWNNTSVRVSFVEWMGQGGVQRLRVRAMYPAYRGDCWTDFDGENLLGMLRPIFPPNTLSVQVADYVSGLGVLK